MNRIFFPLLMFVHVFSFSLVGQPLPPDPAPAPSGPAPIDVILRNQLQLDVSKAPENLVPTPIGFELEASTDEQTNLLCQKLNNRVGKTAIVHYRDQNARLHKAQFIVCIGENDLSPFIAKTVDLGLEPIDESLNHTYAKEFIAGGASDQFSCTDSSDRTALICLPPGYVVARWEGPVVTSKVGDSYLVGQPQVDPKNPNCLIVPYHVSGQGYVNVFENFRYCAGGGSIYFTGTVYGQKKTN